MGACESEGFEADVMEDMKDERMAGVFGDS